MMILAGSHVHHAVGMWPVLAAIGLFLLAGVCAAILLLTRRTSNLPSPTGQGGGTYGVGHEAPPSGFGGPVAAHNSETPDQAEDDWDFEAKILAMLGQKGEPMLQPEIAANLGIQERDLATWIASMERREMIRRRWDAAQSAYVVHLAGAG